jgi:hypothetical protein
MSIAMKKTLLVVLAIFAFLPTFAGKKASKKATEETLVWRYEVQDIGKVAKDGKSVIFKVWSYSKKDYVALMQASKNAVHACIFKQIGYQPALAGTESIEVTHKDFLSKFFADGGEYIRFVNLANNGAVAPTDKIKLKNEYKIGVVVTVNRTDLRKYLEQQGVLESMNSLF